MMYLSPPRPLVMITGHVSSVSTVISALVHHTCLTCLTCLFSVLHLVLGCKDHCKEVVLLRTGSLLTGCAVQLYTHYTALSGPLLYTLNTFCPSVVCRSIHKSFGRKTFALKGIRDAIDLSILSIMMKVIKAKKDHDLTRYIQLKDLDI